MKKTSTFILTTVIILSLLTTSVLPACKHEEKVIREKSFKISPDNKLLVDVDTGDLTITPWDKSEVYIKVIGNVNAEEKFDFEFSGDENEVKVYAEKKGGWGWFSNINLKFEIKVPKNFNVYASTSGGDVKIAGIKGDLNLKTSGGDIWGDRFEGNLSAKTSGGDINIFCNNAKIEAITSGGDIEVEYTGINQGIECKTSGGDIDIKVPENFNANAQLKTSGGDVECRLKLNEVVKISDSKIEANINKGGNSLVAITSGGDITVYK